MHYTVVFAYNPRTFKIKTSEEVDPQLLGWVGWNQVRERRKEERED